MILSTTIAPSGRRQGILGFQIRRFALLPLFLIAGCAIQPPTNSDREQSVPVAPHQNKLAARTLSAASEVDPEHSTDLRIWIDQQSRLYRVAAPLLINNVELCKSRARNFVGITAKTKHSYSDTYVKQAESIRFSDRLQIVDVLPESGAAGSGLMKGDILVSVDGKPFSRGPNAERDAAVLLHSVMKGRSNLPMILERSGETVVVNLPLTAACAYAVELGKSDAVNSYADGYRVMITRGMMNFAKSDSELAYVVAKEVAHNILNKGPRPRMASMIINMHLLAPEGKKVSGSIELRPYAPKLDAAADELAMYLLARAGYNIDQATQFWERLAKRYPATEKGSYTELHPSTEYRILVMDNTVRKIRLKTQQGRPLLPD